MDSSAPRTDDYHACNLALRGMGGAYRVDCWRRRDFRGCIRSDRIGALLLADVTLSHCVVRRDFDSGIAIADHYNLVLQVDGHARMRQCGCEALLLPGDLTIIDSRYMSEFEATEGFRQQVFAISAAAVREAFGGSAVPLARTISGSTGTGRLLADIVASCCRNATGLRGVDLIGAVVQVLAAALGQTRVPERMAASRGADRADLERYIDANIERLDLNPRSMARHFGVSLRQLYRVTVATGRTPAALIWSRRLARAHDMLAREHNGARVLDIALSCGFKDGAHFSRAYRREFGHPPRESRGHAAAVTAAGARQGRVGVQPE
jgi:AraC-like DNA-binding protein